MLAAEILSISSAQVTVILYLHEEDHAADEIPRAASTAISEGAVVQQAHTTASDGTASQGVAPDEPAPKAQTLKVLASKSGRSGADGRPSRQKLVGGHTVFPCAVGNLVPNLTSDRRAEEVTLPLPPCTILAALNAWQVGRGGKAPKKKHRAMCKALERRFNDTAVRNCTKRLALSSNL